MADLREDFIQYVVKALVDNPDAVALKRVTDDRGEYIELTVDPSDMGKVIGKAGATAKSLRTLLRGVGAKDDLSPLPLKIVDPEGDRREAPAAATPVEAPVEELSTEEAPVVSEPEPQPEPAPIEEAEPETSNEHDELRERTKREVQDFADFDL